MSVIGILALAANAIMGNSQGKARDATRLRDIQALKSAVTLYKFDNDAVPNDLPNPLNKTDDLDGNLQGVYINKIPHDPVPIDDTYRYVYYLGTHGGNPAGIFELNVRLETPIHDDTEESDGGNVDDIYEVGIGAYILGASQSVGVQVSTTSTSIQWENTTPEGGGEPTPCNGLTPTIYVDGGTIVGGPDDGKTYVGILNGSNQDDVISGTDNDDIINADSGVDSVCGFGGNDYIDGEQGADEYLSGGNGNDTLISGPGNDTLDGGDGNDTIYGDNGKDTIYGGDGNDSLTGGGGIDTIDGGPGVDTCSGENLSNCES